MDPFDRANVDDDDDDMPGLMPRGGRDREEARRREAEAEATLARTQFRTLRDEYLEPRPSQELELRKEFGRPISTSALFDARIADMFQIYQPKNGDYSNIQRFAKGLSNLADSLHRPVLYAVLVSLPECALVMLDSNRFQHKVRQIRLDGTSYESTGLLLETARYYDINEYMLAKIFIPQSHSLTQKCIDGDMVLRVMASWGLACKQGCTLSITANDNQNLDNYLTPLQFEHCMTELSSLGRELKLCLHTVSLPDDWWQRLAPCPLVDVTMYDTLVPVHFWQTTRAKQVGLVTERRGRPQLLQSVEFALSGLQSREIPTGQVRLSVQLSWTTPQDTIPLLKAMHGTKSMVIYRVIANPTAWEGFWRSLDLINNRTLQQLTFSMTPDVWYDSDRGTERPLLPVIYECLTRNLFLVQIKLSPRPFGNAAADYWRDNIEPLLEMNRRHEHRLSRNERRQWLLHQRLFQVSCHPKKLFKLLRDFRQVFGTSLGG